jgi:hypothetical protein
MGQQQQYLSTDPNAGDPLRGAYLATNPDAGEPRAGESLRGINMTEEFFRGHLPIDESGKPLDRGFLDRVVDIGQGLAHPTTLGDMAGLAVPSMVPEFRVPLTNMIRQALAAAKKAPSLRSTPKAVMGRLIDWAFSSTDDLARDASKAREMAPRLAGKAPTVNDALVDALNDARQAPTPQRVSLPGGDAVRAAGPVPQVDPSGPRMGAYSSQPTPPASATPPAAPSAAPPAAGAPAPSRSTPAPAASIRLTREESQALQALVAEGHDPADVVQAIVQNRQAAQPSVTPKASGKPSLSAAETKEYQRLLSRGKTPEQAMAIIDQQRVFVANKGLPTSEETRRSVADRNATGRWD